MGNPVDKPENIDELAKRLRQLERLALRESGVNPRAPRTYLGRPIGLERRGQGGGVTFDDFLKQRIETDKVILGVLKDIEGSLRRIADNADANENT